MTELGFETVSSRLEGPAGPLVAPSGASSPKTKSVSGWRWQAGSEVGQGQPLVCSQVTLHYILGRSKQLSFAVSCV